MYEGKRVLAVVPARGGSKGVPLKNLREIGGRSLMAWVGGVIRDVPQVDRAVVSTDHEGIAAEAERNGIAAPFRRPEELSGDRIGDIEVLQHALAATEEIDDIRYDIVVMLQPTSPSRKPEHVIGAIRELVDHDVDAVWSVSETDLKLHPLKQLAIDEEGGLRYYDEAGAGIVARQQLQPVYHRNGVVYAMTRDAAKTGKWLPDKARAIVIPDEVVNIDTEDDLAEAQKKLCG